MKLRVHLKENSYSIHIKKGILNAVSSFCLSYSKILLVTDSGVPKQYIDIVKKEIPHCLLFTLKKGEKNKNMQSANAILHQLFINNFDRHDLILAIGGGVVLDLCAFVASIYKRGMHYGSIPTTVLAQVDSCIGGKNGINYDSFKNGVGTFYHPKFVLIDPLVLDTLPKRHWNNGLIEALKMGLIHDKNLFDLIATKNIKKNIQSIIYHSLKNKIDIIEQDVHDIGIRQILNYGHTLGHAIESYCNFKVLHGEAVAYGMVLETKQNEIKEQLLQIYQKIHLKKIKPIPLTLLKPYIMQDKKRVHQSIIIPQINQIGSCQLVEISMNVFFKQMGDEIHE